jgi:hypothetical protein
LPLPPVTQSNISTSWSANFFTVILTTNEACDTYYTVDGSNPISSATRLLYVEPFTISEEGIFTVKFYSISQSTLISNLVQSQQVKIDNTPPVTAITPAYLPDGSNGWYVTLTTVTLSATDNISGVSNIKYAWDGAAFVTYTGVPLPVPGQGIHYLQVYATDNASNREKTQTKVFKFDDTAPTTSIQVPQSVSHVPVTVTFVPTDNASGYGTTYYTTDGTTPTLASDHGPSVDIADAGFYTVRYFSVDAAGNVESVRTSDQFRLEFDTEVVQLLIAESFPINGKNGWYRSSPMISLLSTKPNLTASLQYKVAPASKPTTATYTSTVQITGEIDLSNGSFIALNIDQSTTPLVISIRGVDATKTTITDIIERINATYNGDIPIASETGADGLTGTGYVTVTSPTAGTGSPTSEIEFVSPGTFDATQTVFGLDPDFYPYTYTETYLYQSYTVPFLLPGSGVWNVAATLTTTTNEQATVSKNYNVDSVAPVTIVSVTPGPNPQGFYTTSPDITFVATDNVSGVERTVYQFDNGPIFEYHASDGPVHLPSDSKLITLRCFSVDIAGNSESYHEQTFNYDFLAPTTTLDINAVNLDSQNILDVLFAPAQIVQFNPYLHTFEFSLTPTQRRNLSYFAGWTNDLASRIYDAATPVSFAADPTTDVITYLPVYSLQANDIVTVSSTGILPAPLVAGTSYYVIYVTDTEIKLSASAGPGAQIDITTAGSGLMTLVPQFPTIVVFDPLRLYLLPIDDREYQITNETVIGRNVLNRQLTVANGFLKHVIRIYNQTTLQTLSFRYFSDDKIFTVESFALSDVIVVDYVYTKVDETYYTTDGSTPTTSSASGHIIDLLGLPDDPGPYHLKWFSVDEAGNEEAVKSLSVTIVVINRAPVVNLSLVKSTSLGTLYNPNGTNGWYKRDLVTPTLLPTIKIEFSSPVVPVFNENSPIVLPIPGGLPPYVITLQVLKVDPSVEYISNVTRVWNVTKGELYTILTYGGTGPENEDQIRVQVNTFPASSTDVLEVDYELQTVLDTSLNSRVLKIGEPLTPDVAVDFSLLPSPYYYLSPGGYNVQGDEKITITVNDLRDAQTVVDYITQISSNSIKLDTLDPVSTDNVPAGWQATSVVVQLQSTDATAAPPPIVPDPSNIYRIYYSTDGSSPSTLYFSGSIGSFTLSASGDYTIKYRAIDNAGNEEIVKTATNHVQIDKIPPVTSITVPPPDGTNGWYKTPPSIALSAVDAHSGVYKTYYKWDTDVVYSEYLAAILIPGEGIHTLYYYSVDNVGNTEVVKNQEFKLDTVVPVTTDNITGSWTNDPVVTLSVVDVSSGPYRTYYTLTTFPGPCPDPTILSPFTDTQQVIVPASGVYSLKYFTVDNAGNVELVKLAANQLYLDLTVPTVVSIDPPDLIFTIQTHLTVDFTDTFSGIDVNSIRIVVDDIEYSTTKNSSYFSYTGTIFALQVKVGPIASIPNFDNLETLVVYGQDLAGNAFKPVVVAVVQPDTSPPYIRGFWPRDGANDVSRSTNVVFFIDDDQSGVDLRTLNVRISNVLYQVSTTNILTVEYTGFSTQVFMDVFENTLSITVDGIVITSINLTTEDYNTVKKVQLHIDALSDFTATVVDAVYDQELSIDFISLYHVSIDSSIDMPAALFENNLNVNCMPRSRGYLVAVTPNETFDDNTAINVTVDASDFSGHAMTTEQYTFTCKDIVTPPRDVRDQWYQTHVDIVSRIRSNLESTYNKNSDSTVFHGYFRALALEIARAQQQVEDYRDDMYYDGSTTRPELLYQNIGYLLKTPPQSIYTHEQYRTVLLTIIQMLFNGPTKESILEGMAVFLDIFGLSLHANGITEYTDLPNQFGFTFDVSIGDTPIASWDVFNQTIDAVLRLVKPAHTYFLIRYLFAEIIRTQDIQDEIVKWDFAYNGSEDVRTNCAEKYMVAEIITEDVSNQFTGTNNCCDAFYTPILTWDESTITVDPTDINAVASGGPITVISVDGFTGRICFDRDPAITETVTIIYKFNRYVIYRRLGFYLNTYTPTGGGFDLTRPSLLNQLGQPVTVIIAYNIPEQMHAHICETDIFIDAHYGTLNETWPAPQDSVSSAIEDVRSEDARFDIGEKYAIAALINEDAEFDIYDRPSSSSALLMEEADLLVAEYGVGIETNPNPFETNDIDSITNEADDMLFFLIERIFGG